MTLHQHTRRHRLKSATDSMPPKSSATKQAGKDLRSFFSGGSSHKLSQNSTTAAKAGPAAKDDAFEIVENNSSKIKASPKQTRTELSRSEQAMIVDSDEEEHGPRLTGKRTSASGSTSKAVPKATLAKRKRFVSSDEDDHAMEKGRSPKTKKKSVAAPAKTTSSRKASSATGKASHSGRRPSSRRHSKAVDDDFVVSDDEDEGDAFDDTEEEEEEEEEAASKKKRVNAAKAPSRTTKPTPLPVSTAAQNVTAMTVAATTSEPQTVPISGPTTATSKFSWAAAKAAKMAGPKAPGSKLVPESKTQDCLLGLSFVFTGELSSFSRQEAIDLAKRFGGRVTLQPSSKTSYVVLGEDAGPSKLAAIKKHGLRTLSEDQFLELIGTRVGPSGMEGGAGAKGARLDQKFMKKMEREEEAIRSAAREMEKREIKEMKQAKEGKAPGGYGGVSTPDMSTQLWTTRYAPKSLKEICGNKGQVEKLKQWLHDWPSSLKSNFKKPGKNGMNVYRAVLITGSPGIGKTTAAHLCAEAEGYTAIEMNASDTRSKKLVEEGMNVNNLSLDGWIAGQETTNALGMTITDRTCLIMDEVDGMSAGDRGGVGALNALIKKTRIPIICIANDAGAQKLKPLMSTTCRLPFRKPDAGAVRSRMLTIAYKEKMKVPANVIDQLIEGAQSDIRQILNMLSTWRLSNDTMTFDEGKDLAKMNEKYTILTPFDVTNKMLGPYLFSRTSRETLNDKMELYFHDHAFVPLFIQENYLKTQPARVRDLEGPPKTLKHLQLMDKAASSISDSDLVDVLIHGPEQYWSLMPLHAVCSTVRPASFLYGSGMGYGGPSAMSFPQWLGQNSKQNKLGRQLGDIQARMRLKVSGDKVEIRQSYIPAFFPYLVKPLVMDGSDAVDDVIERMDEYYLTREDWDTIVELGVDENKDDVLKKIPAATKSAFTRRYNAGDHPIAFHKAVDLGKAAKKISSGTVPDLEEAFELDDELADVSDEETKKPSEDQDIGGDKLIVSKSKKTARGKGKAKR
ncbi:replication factor RFC1 C terminal domain-containing protein [Pisolithus marmoratus]|nr:replication factor RFC1 C terminal domain-containing protein [Pisolithus marmoratus]